MSQRKKLSSLEKQKKLIEKIEKAKNDLNQLRSNRIIECGELLAKYGLDQLDNDTLDRYFQKLTKELTHETATKDKKEATASS